MNSIVILADGDFPSTSKTRRMIDEASVVICCDGAASSLIDYGRKPDFIVGDMDSLPSHTMDAFADIITKDSDQETNDLTKSFKKALEILREIHADYIHILGATGKREDHTLANISLLADYVPICPCPIDIVSEYGKFISINESSEIEWITGKEISIFAFDNTLKIHSKGLEYPTDNVSFDSLWPATLNIVKESPFLLTLSHPAKVLVFLAD